MKRHNKRFQNLLGPGLLLILAAGLILIFLCVPAQRQIEQARATVAELAQAPTQGSPIPPAMIISPIYPTETPLPTLTAWPTPRRRPGPTATAIVLPLPAVDASGSLFYAVRTHLDIGPEGYATEGDIYQVQIDAKGEPVSPAKPTALGWVQPYLSLDHSLVAFIKRTMIGDRVFMLDPKSGEIKPVKASITYDALFSGWHPNNQAMLYRIERSPYGGLWLIGVETDTPTIIVQQEPLYIQDAVISPNGQRVVYTQQKSWDTPGELWTVFSDGTDPKLVITGAPMMGLTWSPDGNKISFFGDQGLCVISLEDPVCKVITQDANAGYMFTPVWSPDSRYLAYVAVEPNLVPPDIAKQGKERVVQDWDAEAFVGSNIHILDMMTGDNKVLSRIEPSNRISGNIDPTWSPDGKLIAFVALRGKQGSVWVVNVDGTGMHEVADSPDLIRFPAWTR